ncbi:amidase [soil metagenome]
METPSDTPTLIGEAFVQRFDLPPISSGPLDGFTFAAKDLIDIAGLATGCGNPAWAASHPPAAAHAVAVEILLASGARCLGKTITDEFAFSLVGENHFYGTPLNPRAPDRIPGGSSSGSASAVASGQVDFALGTDTAGSVRVPAANCGIFGLRPTWGRWTMAGIQPLAPGFDTLGIFARNPAILGRVAGCLSGAEDKSVPVDTVLILEEAWELADPEIRDTLPLVVSQLKQAGLAVEAIALSAFADGDLARDIFTWKQTFSGVQWPEVWSTYGAWLTEKDRDLGPKIAENFANVCKAGRVNLIDAMRHRERAHQGLHRFLLPGTALCLPTIPCPPPLRGKVDYDRSGSGYLPRVLCLAAFANLAGLPQINLPLPVPSELPAGLSFVGAPRADGALILLAEKTAPLLKGD